MRAVTCKAFGLPPTLELVEIPNPTLRPGHVIISVSCCGIGFPDVLLLAGSYQLKPALPWVPGAELAGIVTHVAPDVKTPTVGTRVLWLPPTLTGGLAEAVSAPAASVVEIPDAVSFAQAVGLASSYVTSFHALTERGSLRRDESLLVLGAASSVGIAAVELGKVIGAHVIAAASTVQKLELAFDHGADDGFLYQTGSIKWNVMTATSERGVDVVFDPIGGAATNEAVRSIRSGGRLLAVGFASGSIPAVPLNLVLLKNCSLVGVSLGHVAHGDPALFRAHLATLFRLHSEGRLRPVLREFKTIGDYKGAVAAASDRHVVGKCIVWV